MVEEENQLLEVFFWPHAMVHANTHTQTHTNNENNCTYPYVNIVLPVERLVYSNVGKNVCLRFIVLMNVPG